MTNIVCGIDLGTTNSCIGDWVDGSVKILKNSAGKTTTPSCVAFIGSEVLVGDLAFEQQTVNTSNTIFDAKRIIGKRYGIISNELDNLPFAVISDENDRMQYVISMDKEDEGDGSLDLTKSPDEISAIKEEEDVHLAKYPEEISAIVLKKIKEDAEKCLKQEVK